jgi:hypothetical protein
VPPVATPTQARFQRAVVFLGLAPTRTYP